MHSERCPSASKGPSRASALDLQFGRQLFVDGFPRLGKVILRLPEPSLAAAKVGLLGCELRLELFACLGDERRRKRLGQLDLGATIWADNLRVGHRIGTGATARNCTGILGAAQAVARHRVNPRIGVGFDTSSISCDMISSLWRGHRVRAGSLQRYGAGGALSRRASAAQRRHARRHRAAAPSSGRNHVLRPGRQ